jgi:hypothetical protein
MPRHAARPASFVAASNVIMITGMGDHDQPKWPISISGIRKWPAHRTLGNCALVTESAAHH